MEIIRKIVNIVCLCTIFVCIVGIITHRHWKPGTVVGIYGNRYPIQYFFVVTAIITLTGRYYNSKYKFLWKYLGLFTFLVVYYFLAVIRW